jgi:hypothetical protein
MSRGGTPIRSQICGGVCPEPDSGNCVCETAEFLPRTPWYARFRRRFGGSRKTPAAAGLFPAFEHSIDLIFDQPDGRRPTHRADSGFGSAVGKPEFPAPSAAIRQLNDGIFNAFIFHKISSHPTPAKAEGASLACEITTE